jgi:GDP-4-dehydro-6-deoxy-D-mannose reductase
MRVLITGATGFVGSHLAEYCLEQGAEVWGTKRWRSSLENINHLFPRLKMIDCDITDSSSVRKALDESQPDWVFHLAAQSYVQCSFSQPRETLYTNIQGQINFLHGLKEKLFGRLLTIGSSEEYGLVTPEECPIREGQALRPLSPYGVSKVTQDLLAYQYFKSYGLDVVRTRAFNHTGPRRGEVFAESSFAKQIAEMESGENLEHVLSVGNLEAVRDYTDVRDMVRAYWLALEQGEKGEVYNICSGIEWRMSAIVGLLIGNSRLKDIADIQDPARMRPSDVPLLIGDCSKFNGRTGWVPEISIEKTMLDLLNYWRIKKGVTQKPF